MVSLQNPEAEFATDWEMIHYWRGQCAAIDLSEQVDKFATNAEILAFCQLVRVTQVDVILDAHCGAGYRTIAMSANAGLSGVLGIDQSANAISQAWTNLCQYPDADVQFAQLSWTDLPTVLPHKVGAIFNHCLVKTPLWDNLCNYFRIMYTLLTPGGFLWFAGPGESVTDNYYQIRRRKKLNCNTLVLTNSSGIKFNWLGSNDNFIVNCCSYYQAFSNYLDQTVVHTIKSHSEPQLRIELTKQRLPEYWTWQHLSQAALTAGFACVESVQFPGMETSVNLAWRDSRTMLQL